jgi:GT2 family glycosyltransferase
VSTRAMAVLIVGYRSASKLEKCLLSVGQYLPDHKVHVWDNFGAAFPDVWQLPERNQHIHWYFSDENIGFYFSDENIGFAAAVNKLAAAVPNHDLLLLNPDAGRIGPLTLTGSAIQQPGIAAAGPMVWEMDLHRSSHVDACSEMSVVESSHF